MFKAVNNIFIAYWQFLLCRIIFDILLLNNLLFEVTIVIALQAAYPLLKRISCLTLAHVVFLGSQDGNEVRRMLS